jgi:hypothetical protein
MEYKVRGLKRNGVGRIRRNWMRETHEEERSWKKGMKRNGVGCRGQKKA